MRHQSQIRSLGSWFLALGSCLVIASCSEHPTAVLDKPARSSKGGKPPEISFGRRQVDQMLADRPDMVGILGDEDPIVLWVIESMNGERIGKRIYWNANSPSSGATAEHASAYGHYPPHICVSGGTEITGIDRWVCVVYELFNIENTAAFAELWSKALEGKLDGDTYADECAKLEYIALQKTAKFFAEKPLPNAKPGFNAEYDQLRNLPATFEEYLAEFKDAGGKVQHPGKYYKDYYDETIVPYLKSTRPTDEKWHAAMRWAAAILGL